MEYPLDISKYIVKAVIRTTVKCEIMDIGLGRMLVKFTEGKV